jgi:hypothetical protein
MPVVDAREMFRGRSRQTSYGDTPVYTRIFLVRVDELAPDFQEISEAPGVSWLDPHPEDSEAVLIESNVSQDGDSPFHYKVSFTYKTSDGIAQVPWDRPFLYSFSGGLASAPAFWYFSGGDSDNDTKAIIHNTAGDPIGGLDRDEGEFQVTITGNFPPPFPYGKAQLYVGAINSDTWSGGAPKTWKCMSITANRKIESIPVYGKVIYYEVNTTLAYRNTGWDLQTWDVGFNQIIGGQRFKILSSDGPVSEPVALQGGLAKTPGLPPNQLTFRIYPMRTFADTFPEIPDANPNNASLPGPSWGYYQ